MQKVEIFLLWVHLLCVYMTRDWTSGKSTDLITASVSVGRRRKSSQLSRVINLRLIQWNLRWIKEKEKRKSVMSPHQPHPHPRGTLWFFLLEAPPPEASQHVRVPGVIFWPILPYLHYGMLQVMDKLIVLAQAQQGASSDRCRSTRHNDPFYFPVFSTESRANFIVSRLHALWHYL